MNKYDIIIIGAGPGGIYSAYELINNNPDLTVAIIEAGKELEKRKCPINGTTIKNCIHCDTCSIMSGFGGAGAFSDGKYNITNDFGGTLFEYIGKEKALDLMYKVDKINLENGGKGTKLYSTTDSKFKRLCMQNNLKLLDASVRHLGTDKNYVILEHLYNFLKDKIDFYFNTNAQDITTSVDENDDVIYNIYTDKGTFYSNRCIISVGRSGSIG